MTCEDQYVSSKPVRECNIWPCNGVSLIKNEKGFWVCPKCYASYGKQGEEE